MKKLIFIFCLFLINIEGYSVSRYWVVSGATPTGTGLWSDINHWSTSDGGAGGSSVPDATMDVYFTAASFNGSGQRCSVNSTAYCKSLNASTVDDTGCRIDGYSTLTVSGNITCCSNFYLSVSYVLVNANSVITSNSSQQCGSYLQINGSGITVTLGDSPTWVNTIIYLYNGTFDTNGFNCQFASIMTQTGTKSLVVSDNTITLVSWYNNAPTGFTFNPNTSVVEFKPATTGYCIYGGTGVTTFYDVLCTGTNTCSQGLQLAIGMTITNNFTVVGYNDTYARWFLFSSIFGTNRTITAANVSIQYADFESITGAGTGDWDLTAELCGNAGDNSGITFVAGQTNYWHEGSGSWSNAGKWFLGPNGTGGAGRVPLPQDNAIGDGDSFDGTSTITIDMPLLGTDIDFSAVDQTLSWYVNLCNTENINLKVFGNYLLNGQITQSYSKYYSLVLHKEGTLNMYFGLGNYYNVTIEGVNSGSIQDAELLSNVVMNNGFLMQYGRNFDSNGYNITCSAAAVSNAGSRNIQWNNSTITVTGISGVVLSSGTTGTHNFGTSTFVIAPVSGANAVTSQYQGVRKFYNFVCGGNHSGTIDVNIGGGTTTNYVDSCYSFSIEKGRKVRIRSTDTWVVDNFTATGESGSGITLKSVTAGSKHHFIKNIPGDVTCDYMTITDSDVKGYFGAKSINKKLFANVNKANGIPYSSIKTFNRIGYSWNWYATHSTGSNTTGWIITP